MDRPLDPEFQKGQRRKRVALAGSALSVTAFLVAGLPGLLRPSVSRNRIRTARAEMGPVEASITASGIVQPEREAVLSSPVDARVVRILKQPGVPQRLLGSGSGENGVRAGVFPAARVLHERAEIHPLPVQGTRGPAGNELARAGMRFHQRRSQDLNPCVTRQDVEVMDPIPEAVLVAKELRQRTEHEMKRTATLLGIAARLHADLGKRFGNSF